MNTMKKIFTAILLLGTLMASAQVTLITEDFESYTLDAALDGIGTPKYDHTYGGAFDPAETNPNMLGFYAGTGTNWVVKADPLNASNKTLWVSGSDNPLNAGRGIYMMRLDPTGGGAYTSGSVDIKYSFRIMRDGVDPDSPTNFSVAWVSRPESADDGSENLDMFTWAGESVDQTFVATGNEETWVTVSGTISTTLASLDTTSPYSTGIRVYATDGGFVSGGSGIYYIDDFSVTVEPAAGPPPPPPGTLIAEDFESYSVDVALDGISTGKYDHTYGGEFNVFETDPNMLGFFAGSGTDWVVKADPLDPGNKTLWVSGSDNPLNPGRGIYMMRLDPTAGGLYTSGTVDIVYSFRMLRDGAVVDSPTNFSVAWVTRPESLDDGTENLDMFTWTGETVDQTFVTSGNEETWVTVSGTITADLSTLDTTSPYSTGIRVYATNGAFVGGGSGLYYIDDFNVKVEQGSAGHPPLIITETVPVGGDLQIAWYGLSGYTYQVEKSSGLSGWTSTGTPQAGADGPLTHSEPLPGGSPLFLRVEYTAAP